ncbi:hypothetical protein [Geminicoccus harenae]|uniref:hypothetical protein n=1 Tax=Geminicoccus harenae TaxID=2498453 RepID=UPI00168AB932|nr:hypothetical protein [Geminicoccus harenae]
MSQPDITVAEKTLLGDLRDAVLQEIKAADGRPWAMLGEKAQRAMVERVEARLFVSIRAAVRIMAAREWPVVIADVESVTIKDGLKIVAKASATQANVEALAFGTGSALIVRADAADYFGKHDAAIDLDEPQLPMDDAA